MYKFKNVKKLLIEFSRGEGLSVPTDSIKFVKVDGDELSGAAPSGSSEPVTGDVPTVNSLMSALIESNQELSDYNEPDAYCYIDNEDNPVILSNVEDLFLIVAASGLEGIIPLYSSDTVANSDGYFDSTWQVVSGDNVTFSPLSGNSEYVFAESDEGAGGGDSPIQ